MAQEAPNSSNNINLPHNISIWFQQNWTGDFYELGDCLIDAFSITPEFTEHNSYRNGLAALRKRLLTNRAATLGATLYEPNITNLQRVLYGGTISTGNSVTVYEGRHMTVEGVAGAAYFDMTTVEDDVDAVTITGVYAATDVQEGTNLISVDIDPDSDGQAVIDETDVGLDIGDIAYVRYQITVTTMFGTEIFGASEATIEGAAQVQARNTQGGVQQIWSLASVQLAPNGDLSYPLDAVQSVPVLLTLQERSGTFGTLYTK